jgi:hypothetical protein
VKEPLPPGWAENDPHARSEFWDQVTHRPVATNDEVFHGLLLYLNDVDTCPDYGARVKALKARSMLPPDFIAAPDEPADRGTLAFALVHVLKIDGGLTMRVFGASPRYAVRALEYRGIYPTSSPNQGITGAQFAGIMQKAEEFERGNPADAPAAKLPGEIRHEGGPLAAALRKSASDTGGSAEDGAAPAGGALASASPNEQALAGAALADSAANSPRKVAIRVDIETPPDRPFFLADGTPASAGQKKLNVIITGVEGSTAEARKTENDPWARARVGLVLHENAEFRTGPKSAIRFIIPPDQTYALDSQGTTKVLQAVANGPKVKTDVASAHGRVRTDIDKGSTNAAEPIRIEQAGIEHDATIRSPNSALALRGTRVSLFEQDGFDPEAVSLTGAAEFINTRGQRVPFGGQQRAAISGAQTSAAEQAVQRATILQSADLARIDFENHEISIVIQRGGFVSGDVIVGNLHLSDFPHLPGTLDFVLQWTGGAKNSLNDLNLAVFSPLSTASKPDFVANPPFLVSLTPNDPASIATRAKSYPENSPSGGSISKNSVGPDGLELASWPKNYPVGTYKVVVFDLLDAKPPPTQTINPVTYTIDVFLNGRKLINTYTNTIGFLQTSTALAVPVPASGAATASVVRKPVRRPVVRTPVQLTPTVVVGRAGRGSR